MIQQSSLLLIENANTNRREKTFEEVVNELVNNPDSVLVFNTKHHQYICQWIEAYQSVVVWRISQKINKAMYCRKYYLYIELLRERAKIFWGNYPFTTALVSIFPQVYPDELKYEDLVKDLPIDIPIPHPAWSK